MTTVTTTVATAQGFGARPDDGQPGARPADPANQRDSWLRQMEMAQVSDMRAARGPRDATQAAGAAPASAACTPAQATSLEESPALASLVHHASARRNQESGSFTAHDAGPAAQPVQAAIMPPLTVPVALVSASGAQRANLDGDPLARMALRASLAAIGGAEGSESAAVGADGTASAEYEAGGAHEAPRHDAPQFQKRMMHLSGSGDDVSLWIRDAALTQAQSLALVKRLADDMAGAGLRLKGAHVNGKPAPDPSSADEQLFGNQLNPLSTKKDHHGA